MNAILQSIVTFTTDIYILEKVVYMSTELIFRLHKPRNEELAQFYDPIDVRPTEALNFVDDILSRARSEAPDGDQPLGPLTPHGTCRDIKRIMKEQISELMSETTEALSVLKAQGGTA